MNTYERKLAARKERYEALADKAESRSNSAFAKADLREEVSGIPLGQPILIGHHSEGRHRAALKRADNAMRKGIDESKKASYYRDKAASVGRAGISSDDPDAADKLKAKIAKLETDQERMKAANKLVRKNDQDGLAEMFGATVAAELLKGDFCNRKGFPSYMLQNNNANIRRLKQRLKGLERNREREPVLVEHDGFKVVENADDNRVQIFFDGKPHIEVRKILKSNGFRWSRYNMAWQRHLNNAGRYAAECVVRELADLKRVETERNRAQW